MIIVSDTSPLINLAAINSLYILHQLYDQIIIPQAVYDEIAVQGKGQAGSEAIKSLAWIEVRQVANDPMVKALETDLDTGEAEAIVLAVEMKADMLLIDERKGRAVAERLDINHIGLLGILVQAKHNGLIPAVRPIMDELMTKAGFWISNDLYEYVLHTTGEAK